MSGWSRARVVEEVCKERVARVFPRRTNATPDDSLAFVGFPPNGALNFHVDRVEISVTFMEDIDHSHELAEEWEHVAPVVIGGPALGCPGGEFIPGQYVKNGYVITSRGCPNHCWFCHVPGREGHTVRELTIRDGWDVLDSNLLACSEKHIRDVFEMLSRQTHRVRFTGGLEAARLKTWHVELLWNLRPETIFFAYDTDDDLEPLIEAGRMMHRANFTRRHLRCYVLIGYRHDSLDRAQKRLIQAWDAGFLPMAMLWSGPNGQVQDTGWKQLQRMWARPAMTKQVARDLILDEWRGV